MSLLSIENLKTHYYTDSGVVKALGGVDLILEKGESVGIAGESGCGKSTLALSLIRLIKNGEIIHGKIRLEGQSLLELPEKEFNRIRWNRISMISQAAMGGLNPVFTIGTQIVEGILQHRKMKKRAAMALARELLRKVEIDPDMVKNYPHQLSGGMKQRAMIAMALALEPDVVIADEPTTALDVVIQAQIIKMLRKLQKEMNLSVLFISHDLSILAQACDRIMIMYGGKCMESGDTATLFKNPQHPYTRALINAFPDLKSRRDKLTGLPGNTPDMTNPPTGCCFHPRCALVKDRCISEQPVRQEINGDHVVYCHFAKPLSEEN